MVTDRDDHGYPGLTMFTMSIIASKQLSVVGSEKCTARVPFHGLVGCGWKIRQQREVTARLWLLQLRLCLGSTKQRKCLIY